MAGRLSKFEREEYFKKVCEQYEQDGYTKKTIIIGAGEANLMTLVVMLPICVLLALAYYFCHGLDYQGTYIELIVAAVAIIVSYFVHDLLQALILGIFAKTHFQHVYYGFIWYAFSTYCQCLEPLKMWKHCIALTMPTLLLGFIPAIVSVIIGNMALCLYAFIMILLGGVNYYMFFKLLFLRIKSKEKLVMHTNGSIGYVIFYR